jgi:nucleoside 2-deoxyribosyltransferase
LGNNGENFADDYIYLRDCNWIIEADYVIAEVTTPSLGVGYEICYAQNLHKPILCLFNSNSDRRLSAMINGNKNLIVHKYNSIEQAYKFISDFIN